MRNITTKEVQVRINWDDGEQQLAQVENRVIFEDGDHTFTITINDEERADQELMLNAIDQKVKALEEEILTVEEWESIKDQTWVTEDEIQDKIKTSGIEQYD